MTSMHRDRRRSDADGRQVQIAAIRDWPLSAERLHPSKAHWSAERLLSVAGGFVTHAEVLR